MRPSPSDTGRRLPVTALATLLLLSGCGGCDEARRVSRARPDWLYARQASFATGLPRETTEALVLSLLPGAERAAHGDDPTAQEPSAALVTRQVDVAERIAEAALSAGTVPPGASTPLGGCADGDVACVRAQLEAVAAVLWGIAPEAGELDDFAALVTETVADGGTFAEGSHDALAGVLASPKAFLSGTRRGARPVDVARRLSLRLWGVGPDAALLARVDDGATHGDGLRKLLSELLADPRANVFLEDLADAILLSGNLLGSHVDASADPNVTPELRRAIRHEPVLLLREFVDADRPVERLLDADATWVNPALASFYGLDAPSEGWSRVSLAPTARRGLAGTAAFLTSSSQASRTGIARRAAFILTRLLCSPPPPPPAPPTIVTQQATTKREWSDLHRARTECRSCHQQMDPYGFGLEQFGRLGEQRTTDEFGTAPEPADAIGGASWEDAVGFAAALAGDERFAPCLATRIAEAGAWWADTSETPTVAPGTGLRTLVIDVLTVQESGLRGEVAP